MLGGYSGMNQMVVRDATPDDMETILTVERDSYRDPWGEESFRILMSVPKGIAVVASFRFPIAYAFGRVTMDEAELLNLAVSRQFRKRNVGRLLLHEFLQRCWKLDAAQVFLEVRVGNSGAVQLYRSAGFSIVGRRKEYYQDGEDAFIMRLPRPSDTTRV
jgi:[ribosomal protein S18]-alanine N-acetyltransferase